ncbi:hypothetical protein D3C78_1359960 [compost metagenome]
MIGTACRQGGESLFYRHLVRNIADDAAREIDTELFAGYIQRLALEIQQPWLPAARHQELRSGETDAGCTAGDRDGPFCPCFLLCHTVSSRLNVTPVSLSAFLRKPASDRVSPVPRGSFSW